MQNLAQFKKQFAAQAARIAELEAALAQVERLSRTADRAKLDVAAMLGDIARAALHVVNALAY